MFSIPIIIKETEEIDRANEPVTVGIPFPEGVLRERSGLVLHDAINDDIPIQTQVLATWADGSLRWVLFDFQVSVKANSTQKMEIILNDSKPVSAIQSISVQEKENLFIIDTNAASFFVNTDSFRPFERVTIDDKEIIDGQNTQIVLTDESDNEYTPQINNIFFETRGELRTTLKAEGIFKERENSFLNFSSRISFFANHSIVKIEFTILNPKAAKHAGGLWDLGDPNSVLFKDLSLYISLNTEKNSKLKCNYSTPKTATSHQPPATSLLIYQDSSGGENWNSKNHVNRNNEIRHSFKGYKVYSDEEVIEEGERATPIISITDNDKKISVGVQYFWQNFPKALETKDNTLIIRLFPKYYNDLFELQGGEQKTHTIFLDFNENLQGFQSLEGLTQSPLIAHSTPEWYAKTKVFDYLIPESYDPNKDVNRLINIAIKGDQTFFHRREIIDEYGWRNFGEFYADHEAVNHNGPEPFISHYNNQYDCLYTTLFQFARSGGDRWFLLADQLCTHVKDIDIYHTDEDRSEYNHGLFWHTQHYIESYTATHRCFSRDHAQFYDITNYGGGPALSHNYAAGFLFHYYMTGSPSSREAVLDLADFVINNIEMENTFLRQLIDGVRNVRQLLKKRELIQFDKVYELNGPSRASGNALNTLLTAYTLTRDRKYLEKSEELICQCIHPKDDLGQMDMLDVENRWFYTVFLQALAKYLDIKTAEKQLDVMWQYAKKSLINCAKWMAQNEYIYLEKPEKLEFPNETWAAQELRKCNIFLYASKYCKPESRDMFLEKAEYFYTEAIKYLFRFETRLLTRPIVLTMLNGMMYSYFKTCGMNPVSSEESSDERTYLAKYKGIRAILKNLRSFSLKKEIQFIQWRLSK